MKSETPCATFNHAQAMSFAVKKLKPPALSTENGRLPSRARSIMASGTLPEQSLAMDVLGFLKSPMGIFTTLVMIIAVHTMMAYTKLRRFPGPLLAALTDLPHSKAMLSDNSHLWYAKMCNRYGRCRCKVLQSLIS